MKRLKLIFGVLAILWAVSHIVGCSSVSQCPTYGHGKVGKYAPYKLARR